MKAKTANKAAQKAGKVSAAKNRKITNKAKKNTKGVGEPEYSLFFIWSVEFLFS